MSTTNRVVPIGAEHPQALHVLVRKHAAINGEIERVQLELHGLKTDLAHIRAAIRILDPTIDTGRIRAKQPPGRHPAQKGEITAIVFDLLREADGPLTPRQITKGLVERRGLCADDRDLLEIMLKRVRACLRAQRNRGVVRALALDGSAQGWEAMP